VFNIKPDKIYDVDYDIFRRSINVALIRKNHMLWQIHTKTYPK